MELLGYPLSFWDSVFLTSTVVTAFAGGIAVVAALLSSILGYQISNIVQTDADLRILAAQKQADEAHLALEKFKSPRSLTDEQRMALTEKMKKFAGTVFEISGRENEALIFALSITDALTDAGWKVKTWTGGGEIINLPGRPFKAGAVIDSGVHLRTFSKELQEPRKALAEFLKDAAFTGVTEDTIVLPTDHGKRSEIEIIIGPKI